jgi:hypothetical protein
MPYVLSGRKSLMVPGKNIRKIIVLVVVFIACWLLAGPVSAGQITPVFSGITGSCYDPCSDQNQSVCVFGGTCGDRVTMISLGMAGSHFAGTPTSGPAPLQVQFSANSEPGITTTWSWDFGDGSYGSGINPVHTYTTPGTYTVKLTVRQSMASVNYPASAYFSCGEESTWQKDAMIQVTGTTVTSDQGFSGSKGTIIPSEGVIQAGNSYPPVLSIQYTAPALRKTQPLDFQRGKPTQRATVLTSWNSTSLKNGR